MTTKVSEPSPPPSSSSNTPISTVTGEDVQRLLAKLDRLKPYLPSNLPLLDLSTTETALEDRQEQRQQATDATTTTTTATASTTTTTKNSSNKNKPPKHLAQADSMVRHMCKAGFFRHKPSLTTVIEFGCGTAKLSEVVQQHCGGMRHILIDRQDQFAKQHTRVRDRAMMARSGVENDNSIIRRTMDIQDLANLREFHQFDGSHDNGNDDTEVSETAHVNGATSSSSSSLPLSSEAVVAIAKHLCGPATDYTCRAVRDEYLAIATCCHYRCEWNDTFASFCEKVGLTPRDFTVLTVVSQWATIKTRTRKRPNDTDKTDNQDDGKITKEPSSSSSTPMTAPLQPFQSPLPELPTLSPNVREDEFIDSKTFEQTLPRDDKIRLGKRCKLFLDVARAYSLERKGYHVKLLRYTTLSLEDHLLLAVPRQHSKDNNRVKG